MNCDAEMRKALKAIAGYAEMKPENFGRAEHMLSVIGLIAAETLREVGQGRRERSAGCDTISVECPRCGAPLSLETSAS